AELHRDDAHGRYHDEEQRWHLADEPFPHGRKVYGGATGAGGSEDSWTIYGRAFLEVSCLQKQRRGLPRRPRLSRQTGATSSATSALTLRATAPGPKVVA